MEIVLEDCKTYDDKIIHEATTNIRSAKINYKHRVSANIWETYFLIDAIIAISYAVFLRSI